MRLLVEVKIRTEAEGFAPLWRFLRRTIPVVFGTGGAGGLISWLTHQ